jgi:acetyltransferase
MTVRNLEYLFKPKAIALIGQGNDAELVIARNLMNAGFGGPIMPVNRSRRALGGMLTFPDVDSLPLTPDLAVINAPLTEAPALIQRLGERGTRAAAIVSDGLRLPPDTDRTALYQAMLDAARPHLLRMLGPGSLSLCVPGAALNASLSPYQPSPGHVALVIQSNAIAHTAVDHGISLGYGFSHLISLGAAVDVDCADLLDYLANDYHVRAILLYLEHIGDPRKFMSAARRAARIKPVMLLKPRRYSRDGVDDEVYEAAFRRAGILRVKDQHEIFNLVEALTNVKPLANDRLAIVSNSRSLAALAADTLNELGGRLAQLSELTQTGLEALEDTLGAVVNPVDLGDHAGPETYGKVLDLLLKDRGVDGVLLIKSPSALSNALPVAEAVVARLPVTRRCCLFASFPGPSAGEAARRLSAEHRIPTYETPTEAVGVFMHMVQFKRNQELLMETPPSVPETFRPDAHTARRIIDQALAADREQLNELETLRLLAAYGIPVVASRLASTPNDVATIAEELGRPVVLKILSPDIPNRSTVDGVRLFLESPATARETARTMLARIRKIAPAARVEGLLVQPMEQRGGAYELTLGVRAGGLFGPVIYFGQGGTEADVIGDIAYGLPPLNMNLAREMMAQTRIYRLLRYSLLRRADLDAVALTLIKVSQMVIDLGEIVALDINPLWVDAAGVTTVGARVQVASCAGEPPARLAIRPYPNELEERFALADGRELLLRPILPEDEPALQALVRRTPARELMMRFFQPLRELPHLMAAQLTQLDYDREMALAIVGPGRPGKAEIFGVVSLAADPNNERAEYSLMVDHALKGQGLGKWMMRRIIQYARECGLREIYGEVLQENAGMLHIDRLLGFRVKPQLDEPGVMHVTLQLQGTSESKPAEREGQ